MTQEVSVSEPHLAWIDVARIAEGFGVQRPATEILDIAASLTSLVEQNNWRRAELRHDFGNHYVPTSPDDPRAMRAFVLFADECTEIAVGQTMDKLGYPALRDQFEGLPLPDVPYGKRFEFFSYMFAEFS